MAWIARIDNVEKHPNADALDICTIGGWKVVTKLGVFNAGQLAVYFSIDSWIPHELAPFLSNGKEPREFESVKGERLRTIKLRGTCSQGLLLKLENCVDIVNIENKKYINTTKYNQVAESEDVYIQNNKQNQR